MQETFIEVDIDQIRESPFQPRTTFSEEELEELALSIKSSGVIQPPVVRKITRGDEILYYELIAGERRIRASKKAGLTKIKVIVREASEQEAAKATLIENLQRVDLDPIEMSRAFARLIEIFQMTQEQVASKVGKKRSTVANYLRLLTLPSPIQQAITSGKITMGHAKAILSLSDEKMQQMLHDLILEHNLSVRAAEKESRKVVGTKRKNPHLEELETRLSEALGTKVTLTPNSKEAGTVTIHYYHSADLDRLLACLRINEL